jgi:nucleoside-diphosphate-sugar epimerase
MLCLRNRIIEEDLAEITKADLPWSRFSGSTVLVSGANGLLPAYMVETLAFCNDAGLTKNCRIIGLVRSRVKAEQRFAHLLGRSDFRLLAQDVCEPIPRPGDVNFIIHAASQASPRFYGSDPVGTLAANTLGTYNLLSLARDCRAEDFLFFSSGDVYGRSTNPEIPTREDAYGYLDPMDLRSCYGESKRLGETMCVAFHQQHRVPFKIVRPAHTYGPGMNLDDGRVFADFVANVVRGEDIIIKSRGTARRPFCYIADATLAYFLVLLRGADGQAYNVCNENGDLSVAELANLLANLFPERKLKVRFIADSDRGAYIPSPIAKGSLDSSKLRSLGWNPSISPEEGFRRTVLSYES